MLNRKKLLKEFRASSNFSVYLDAMSKLYMSGALPVLRELAMPDISHLDPGNAQVLATNAAFNAGYHRALQDLVNLELIIDLETPKEPQLPLPDFGGTEKAIHDGYLTEEDLKRDTATK